MKKKIVLYLVLFATIPSFLVAVFMYLYISHNSENSYLSEVRTDAARVAQTIDSELLAYVRKSNSVLTNKYIYYYINKNYQQDLGLIINYYDAIDMFLTALESEHAAGGTFEIYFRNESLLQGNHFTHIENIPVNETLKKVMKSSSAEPYWNPALISKGGRQVLTFYRNIKNLSDPVPVGILEVNIPFSVIEQNIGSLSPNGEVLALLKDDSGKTLYKKSFSKEAGLLEEYEKNGRGYLEVANPLSGKFKLVVAVPKSYLSWISVRVLLAIAGVFLVFNILIFLASRFTSRKIVSRLERFINLIRSDYRLVLSEEKVAARTDEITEIKEKFREVLIEMDKYYKEVGTLEMELIQARINPHLLYNSLSVIKWAALWNHDNRTAEMIDTMTKYYRAALNRGNTILDIRSELEMIREYVKIYEFAHSNTYILEMDVEEGVLEFYTIKHIIQPVVENAIIHGLNGREQDCRILIRAFLKGEDIVFSIRDNGHGMDAEKVSRLLSMEYSGNFGGFGIKSVIKRIQAYYGSQYGIEIDSTPGGGTEVRLRIAALDKEQLIKRIS